MFLEQQISILECFLKDHVKLKTDISFVVFWSNKCSFDERKRILLKEFKYSYCAKIWNGSVFSGEVVA